MVVKITGDRRAYQLAFARVYESLRYWPMLTIL